MGIWIDGTEYKGAVATSLNLNSEVQKHPVEIGFAVADNIKFESPQFKVSLTLGGALEGQDRKTEYERLKNIFEKGTIFTFICDLGSYSDMVIQNLSPVIEKSLNTYSCEITVIQIRVASLVTEHFDIVDPDGTIIFSPVKPDGTPPTQSLEDKTVPSEPTKPENESWLSGIVDWITGLF